MERVIRVFLADASRDFMEVLRAELEAQPDLSVVGCAVRGDYASQQLAELIPDVLVTDLLLPGLDGLSLLRQLRDEERMPRTVVVSAFVTEHIAEAVSLLGVMDFLPKPCRLDKLVLRIREAAGARSRPVVRGYDPAIREALTQFCIPPNLNGRTYLEEAVRRTLEDHSVLHGITKILYPELARHFGTTPICIERSIRSAVDTGWKHGSQERRRAFFGPIFDTFSSAPGNAKFIGLIANYIELKYEQVDAYRR